MGALTTFTLSGGPGGMRHTLKIAPELQKWMDALGAPKFTAPEIQAALIEASDQITAGKPISEWIAWRNDKLVDVVNAGRSASPAER
jgi:carnitine 3-dehydrogenase